MAMEFSVFTGTGTPAETRASTMIPAKLSEANALFRNPDRVMATWMVARKRAGCSVRTDSVLALLLPSSTRHLSFVSFMEITATSALAKLELKAVSTIIKLIEPNMVLFLKILLFSVVILFAKKHKKV